MFQNRVLSMWLWYIHVMNDHPSIKIHVEKYWQGKVLTSYAKQDVHVTFIKKNKTKLYIYPKTYQYIHMKE